MRQDFGTLGPFRPSKSWSGRRRVGVRGASVGRSVGRRRYDFPLNSNTPIEVTWYSLGGFWPHMWRYYRSILPRLSDDDHLEYLQIRYADISPVLHFSADFLAFTQKNEGCTKHPPLIAAYAFGSSVPVNALVSRVSTCVGVNAPLAML